jgi:uncharacterized damage-inducible protein DinB
VKTSLLTVLFCALCVVLAAGQSAPPAGSANPLVDGAKLDYGTLKANLTKAAQQVPESLYTYRPTPEVRTFAQLFAHVADANYMFCAPVLGEKPPVADIEKTTSAKADLVKTLGESFAYCDRAFASVTDADAAKPASFFGRPLAKLTILTMNTGHDHEHYGNVVTYMRLNKMVPPSSQR